jgi:hypothetical protein
MNYKSISTLGLFEYAFEGPKMRLTFKKFILKKKKKKNPFRKKMKSTFNYPN